MRESGTQNLSTLNSDFVDDSSSVLKRAIFISVGIHLLLGLIFLSAKIPVIFHSSQEATIVNYQEVQKIFRQASREITSMPEVAKASTRLKRKSSGHQTQKIRSGKGLLNLDLVHSSASLLELPLPKVPGVKADLSKKIGISSEVKEVDAPVRLISLDSIQANSYKGGISESLKISEKTQAVIGHREIEVRGGLEDSVVRQIIEERLPAIRICYETALLQNAELQGEVMMSWTVQPLGNVSDVVSESHDITNTELQSCIRERVSQWKFPEPKGGGIVNIRYPFVFRRVNG